MWGYSEWGVILNGANKAREPDVASWSNWKDGTDPNERRSLLAFVLFVVAEIVIALLD